MTATQDSELMRQSLAAGAITDAATLPELAMRLELSEVETTCALLPLLGRRALEAPYHFAWVTHGVLATQGGAVIDPGGHVLDTAGQAVPGLYAAGGTACGLAGPSSDGYLSGNGLLSAFGMGWIIGNTLGRAQDPPPRDPTLAEPMPHRSESSRPTSLRVSQRAPVCEPEWESNRTRPDRGRPARNLRRTS